MFSGIINHQGEIKQLTVLPAKQLKGPDQTPKNATASGLRCTVIASSLAAKLSLGQSLAVNGVCLTVSRLEPPLVEFELSPHTCQITQFRAYQPGDIVNLELGLKLSDLIDGHLVQGHVDGLAELKKIVQKETFAEYSFFAPVHLRKYLSLKGSVALDGVSLTISALSAEQFTVALVPYTLAHTNFSGLKPGSIVHIETDLIARYLERLTSFSASKSSQ